MSRRKNKFPEDGNMNPKIKNQEICVQVRTIQILDDLTLEKCVEELLRLGLKEYWKREKRSKAYGGAADVF